jgi:TolA-binding protein
MSVVGLHPEDLFDKQLEGELTPSERDRLRAHLDVCDVCRFEQAARVDFHAEALELSALTPPPALPLRPAPSLASRHVAHAGGRRRPRWLVWGLSAAALISASGALAAAGLSGQAPWTAVSPLFAPSAKANERLAPVVKRSSPVRRVSNALVAGASTRASGADVAVELAGPALAPATSALPGEPATAAERRVAARAGRSPSEPARTRRSAPSRDADEATESVKAPHSAAKLFGDANQARRAGDVGRASALYQQLQEQFPGSPEADLSRVTLALLLLDSGDARGALVGFERYLAGPSRSLEAEALVGRARALARLGRRELEISAWREVQRKYAHSVYGRQASERLAALGQP